MISPDNNVSVSVELSLFSDEDGHIFRGQSLSTEVGARRSSVNSIRDVSFRNLTKSRSEQPSNQTESRSEQSSGQTRSRSDQPSDQTESRSEQLWDFIFMASSALSVFVDPLICYAPVFDNDRNCFYRKQNLIWICLGLRTFGDVFYATDVALFLAQSPKNDGDNKHYSFVYWRKWLEDRFPKFSHCLKLKSHKSLKLFLVLPRIFAALPILEAMVLVGKYTNKNGVYNNFFYVIPIQYVLRDYKLYLLLDDYAGIKTGIGRFLKSLLDLLPFILASHIFGALWYFLAVDRKLACWQEYLCKNNQICTGRSIHSFFHCGERTDGNNKMFNATLLHNACAAQVSETVTKLDWDYGIYQYAFQSDLTTSKSLLRKFLQSLWWGLRNLSSFGSNLNTSFATNEILFSVLLSISGLTLFLIYLNSRVQCSQKISEQKKEREKKRRRKREKKRRKREEEKKWREKIQTVYPSTTQINEQMRNMWDLRFASVKKVERLANMDDKVLSAICKHMKEMVYNENMHILREGEPLGMMLLLRQGIALTYTTSNGTRTSICECLKKSDFYGEELIDWAFRYASFSEIPISTRTVWSQTKVKAFTISADHLNSVVAEYWWYFKTDLARSQLEVLAASSLQAAWRRYSIRKGRLHLIWK